MRMKTRARRSKVGGGDADILPNHSQLEGLNLYSRKVLVWQRLSIGIVGMAVSATSQREITNIFTFVGVFSIVVYF